jgi:hypothetical protein
MMVNGANILTTLIPSGNKRILRKRSDSRILPKRCMRKHNRRKTKFKKLS